VSFVDVLLGFVPLVVVGTFALLLVRLLQRARETDDTDSSTMVRQLAFYGLLFLTMVLTATGVTWVSGELLDRSRDFDNTQLAQALALIAVGLPVFSVLLRIADHRLRTDANERSGLVWSMYLNIALLTTLTAAMVGTYRALRDMLDSSPGRSVEGSGVAMMTIWGALWLTHWFVMLRRHGVRGDSHLAIGSVVGIVVLGVGNVGLFYVGLDRLYGSVTNDPLVERAGPSASEWAALFAVGAMAWFWYWLSHFEASRRSEAWYITVVPVGALLGFTAAVTSAAALLYLVAVYWIGEPDETEAVRHFDSAPFLSAVLITGLCSAGYHRWLLGAEPERNEPVRAYDYLLSSAALVTWVVGGVFALSGLTAGPIDRNEVLAGVTMLAVGLPLWRHFWTRTTKHAATDPAEMSSHIRTTSFAITLGLVGLTLLFSGIIAVQGILEALLDGRLDLEAVRDQRYSLATLVMTALAAVPTVRAFRGQRTAQQVTQPSAHWPQRVIIVGGGDPVDLDELQHPGVTLEYWHRTDRCKIPLGDIEDLSDQLEHQGGNDVLVVLDEGGPMVIPFTR
jgi:hypothetical protein